MASRKKKGKVQTKPRTATQSPNEFLGSTSTQRVEGTKGKSNGNRTILQQEKELTRLVAAIEEGAKWKDVSKGLNSKDVMTAKVVGESPSFSEVKGKGKEQVLDNPANTNATKGDTAGIPTPEGSYDSRLLMVLS
ncbi:OLC1v1005061C1 [Oldenlandia corymbosa var. corymbosa]|uniref:OLC1v1005061C1 n=1 Tax=Oldenlandia corymbosa var. corymbosa TaxID=529605 RepID=A0AAV1DEC6_OLDCO|nr:OLC1v1005061C1 [Oldenlandia corymbosa var. corymbosa]